MCFQCQLSECRRRLWFHCTNDSRRHYMPDPKPARRTAPAFSRRHKLELSGSHSVLQPAERRMEGWKGTFSAISYPDAVPSFCSRSNACQSVQDRRVQDDRSRQLLDYCCSLRIIEAATHFSRARVELFDSWRPPTRIASALAEGAGNGNRTRMASLEGWNFTIKLCPRFS